MFKVEVTLPPASRPSTFPPWNPCYCCDKIIEWLPEVPVFPDAYPLLPGLFLGTFLMSQPGAGGLWLQKPVSKWLRLDWHVQHDHRLKKVACVCALRLDLKSGAGEAIESSFLRGFLSHGGHWETGG